MFGLFKKKKKPEDILSKVQQEFEEEPVPTVSIKPPGHGYKTRPEKNSKRGRVNNSAEARFLYKHINHVTGKTHTVAEIAEKIGMSQRSVYLYLKDLPKTKKRKYNANRG